MQDNIVVLFLSNVLFVWGLHFASFEVLAPITGRIGYFLNMNKLSWLEKPLYMCRPCMSSVWGWCFWLTPYPWYFYPLWVICLAGASVIIKEL